MARALVLVLNTHPLRPIIASRAVVTLQLVIGAAVFWIVIGIRLGILAARRPRSALDRAAMGLAVLGVSVPAFFIRTLALYGLWFKLGVVPGSGYVPISAGLWPWFRQMLLAGARSRSRSSRSTVG